MSNMCTECRYFIESRSDLVIALRNLKPKPFHRSCFAKVPKGTEVTEAGHYWLNGSGFTRISIILAVIGSLLVFVPRLESQMHLFRRDALYELGVLELLLLSLIMIVVCFGPALLRFYCWDRFEKRLPD